MRIIKKIQLFLFLLAMVNICVGNTVPSEVVDAANKGLPGFLQTITSKKANYGFKSSDQNFVLAEPFELHMITPKALSCFKPGDTVSKIVSKTGIWLFPVLVNGEYRSILTVDKMNNSWKAVSLGRAPLARKLQLIRQTWPISKGYHPQLIVVYQATKYFFHVPEVDSTNITLISSKENKNLENLNSTVGKLNQQVSSAIAK